MFKIPYLVYNMTSVTCGMKIVLQQRDSVHPGPSYLLEKFRDIYNALHQCSNLDYEYQSCSSSSHRMDSTSNLIEVDGGRPAETARAPIITSPALHRHDPVLSVIPPITEYDVPLLLTTPNLDHAITYLSNHVMQ